VQAGRVPRDEAKPQPLPKVPVEDRVAQRVWQALVDAKLVTGELPPKRKPEGER
jgi:hypothetical protein